MSDDSVEIEATRRPTLTTHGSCDSWLDLHSDHSETNVTPFSEVSAFSSQLLRLEEDRSTHFRKHRQSHDGAHAVKQEVVDKAVGIGDIPRMSVRSIMPALETMNSSSDPYPGVAHTADSPTSQAPGPEVNNPSKAHLLNFSPRSRRRISAMSGSSAPRPKKRVLWKGKVCTIALPLDDDRGSRPLLPGATQRLDPSQVDRWDAGGLKSIDFPGDLQSDLQSCGLFPDPVEILNERDKRQFRVGVPNQAEWDSYVRHLNEEKLFALGVSTHADKEPSSVRASSHSAASRASSGLMARSLSPAATSSPALGSIPPSNPRSFSPALPVSNPSTRAGSVAQSCLSSRPH